MFHTACVVSVKCPEDATVIFFLETTRLSPCFNQNMHCSLPAIGLPCLLDPWINSPVNQQYGSILCFHLFFVCFTLEYLTSSGWNSLPLWNSRMVIWISSNFLFCFFGLSCIGKLCPSFTCYPPLQTESLGKRPT